MKADKSEAQWQAEDDARTLIQSHEIRKDKKRYKAAKTQLQKIVKAAKKEALSKQVAAKLEKAMPDED